MLNGGGRPGPFYHMNDILSTKVDRGGRGADHISHLFRNRSGTFFFASQTFETPAHGQKLQDKASSLFFFF